MATALELGREGWEPFLEAARRRASEAAPPSAQQAEADSLLRRVREAASVLKSRFGARRVVLFGSLAHAAWFADDSDVDLAVEGLSGERFWEAWRAVERIIADRPVDFVEIESARDSLRQAIARCGVEL